MHSWQFKVIRNDLKLKRCIMARPKADIPAYLRHSGGLAKVRINSKAHYLGKYGSPESFAKYHAILAAHAAGTLGQEPIRQGGEPNIADLTSSYRYRELPRYESNRQHHKLRQQLIELLIFQYADLPCNEFGPLKLSSLRDKFVSSGNCRRHANEKTKTIIQIFRHGVAREIVLPETLTALESLPNLRRGEAHDNPPRRVPTLEEVEACLTHMQLVPATMVKLQLATACRPSEAMDLRPQHIDRTGKVWVYRPEKHKTAHHGKIKAIPLLGDIVSELQPFMFGDDLCFRTAKGNPWSKDSYRLAIRRAYTKAGVPHWTPYALRHLSAQRVRDAFGVEHAAALLGHSRVDTTEIYSQASLDRSIEAASALAIE